MIQRHDTRNSKDESRQTTQATNDKTISQKKTITRQDETKPSQARRARQ